MVDDVVWLPAHIDGIATAGRLGVPRSATGSQVEPATVAAGRER